jgi:L-serine dehydratase
MHTLDLRSPARIAASALAQAAPGPLSVVDLFTIGVGPSSSHTVGPMRAAKRFAETVAARDSAPVSVVVDLYGSLALTGKGHATDTAIMLGLMGWSPEAVDPNAIPLLIEEVRRTGRLRLAGALIPFVEGEQLIFRMGEFLPAHSNAMRFTAVLADGATVEQQFYSIGGGAIVEHGAQGGGAETLDQVLPYPFESGKDLLIMGRESRLSIAGLVAANELTFRPTEETEAFLDSVREAMFACIERGCEQDGILPGGLNVRRRAKALETELNKRSLADNPGLIFEWVSLYALAVNEENAAGGRVVTAPTNGAAGVIPAVLKYYEALTPSPTLEGSRILLMTAAAIGMLYKKRASISAAEMGCQGEVGVACSMAAAGLAAALGGTNAQVENAAEIGMEHNLGLTCDPIGGLVQVPCIERNTMGAVKAINAAYLALRGDGEHIVSLDAVIETMRQTGEDMRSKYKETSLGGLAVNVVEC